MGRDNMKLRTRPLKMISIHAPAWGATTYRHMVGRGTTISIHAPAWGATVNNDISVHVDDFNSRARMGRDKLLLRGACSRYNFNSRARMGRDGSRQPVRK